LIFLRGGTTHAMLQSTLQYKDIFLQYSQVHYRWDDPPTEVDWNNAMVINKFLEVFLDM